MQIVMISELVYAEPRPKTPEERQEKYNAILAGLDLPVYLGRAINVAYEPKTDRYSVIFIPASDRKLTLKVTEDVVAFLTATGLDTSGYWQGRLEKGALVDVALIRA